MDADVPSPIGPAQARLWADDAQASRAPAFFAAFCAPVDVLELGSGF